MRLLVDTKYDIVSQACFRQQVTRSISNHTLILNDILYILSESVSGTNLTRKDLPTLVL